MIIHSNRIVTEFGIINGYLVVEGKRIKSIVEKDFKELDADIDYNDLTIIPGIFDTHNHGIYGWFPGEGEDSYKDVLNFSKVLASVGVTEIFPTVNKFELWNSVTKAKSIQKDEGALIMGIHSEGPYLNRVGEKGVDLGHPEIDMNIVKKYVEENKDSIKVFGMAPELQGADELIEYLISNNIRVNFAHSNQNYEEAMASFKKGVSVTTHTSNVMSGIHHRNMGGLGACLLNDYVYNEIICDGLHVRNEMIEMMFRIKKDAFHKFMMISDNVHISGFPVGNYVSPLGYRTIDENGFCLTETGRISGSTKPVIYGMKNLYNNLHIPLDKICLLSSFNPNLVYGFIDDRGSISIGKYCDIVVIDENFNVKYTYRDGNIIYDYEKDNDLINHKMLESMRV